MSDENKSTPPPTPRTDVPTPRPSIQGEVKGQVPRMENPPPPPPPPALSNKNVSQNIPVPPVFPSAANKKNQTTERTNRDQSPETQDKPLKPLPQQEIPTPRAKMKTINWNKIHPSKVIGKNNIWSEVANNHQNNTMMELNWDEMEGLFCQQITQSSPKLGKETMKVDTVENRRSRKDEVGIMNISIKLI